MIEVKQAKTLQELASGNVVEHPDHYAGDGEYRVHGRDALDDERRQLRTASDCRALVGGGVQVHLAVAAQGRRSGFTEMQAVP